MRTRQQLRKYADLTQVYVAGTQVAVSDSTRIVSVTIDKESDIRRPCLISVQKLILSYTSTTQYPTDANRRYGKKCSVFAGQRSIGLSHLRTVGITNKNIWKLQMARPHRSTAS